MFTEGEGLQDLAVRPHERIALMRLFICVAQAALDGPRDLDAWKDLEDDQTPLALAASQYLDQWQDQFNLFDPEKPFLQFPGLVKPPKLTKVSKKAPLPEETEEEATAASKLDLALATGNSATLFDHLAANDEVRAFDTATLVLMLVTFQCFSPGGRIGVALWRGTETPGRGSSSHAPCSPSSMLHSFVRRSNLLHTIQTNLLTKEGVQQNYEKPWGRPVWEQMPASFQDATAVQNATETYLGRLMPLSRAILLRPDGRNLLLANGPKYPVFPEFSAEPTACFVKKRDDSGYALVGAGNRALWRELPALVAKRFADKPGGPLALNDLSDAQSFDLWVGALLTDKASILDTIEGVCHIPTQMLNDTGRTSYEREVKECERVASQLSFACQDYRKLLEIKPPGYPEQAVARRLYWTGVELRGLPLLHTYLGVPDGDEAASAALTRWRAALWRMAFEAYHAACADDTPRQRRAYALGLRSLQFSHRKPAGAPSPAGASTPAPVS